MKVIIRFIKKLFGKYEAGSEYLINITKINVNPEWRKTEIGKAKFGMKMRHWLNIGEFESKIILDKDFNLIDGYSSVRIAEIEGIEKFLCILWIK